MVIASRADRWRWGLIYVHTLEHRLNVRARRLKQHKLPHCANNLRVTCGEILPQIRSFPSRNASTGE